jgi:hypothetical protein
VDVMRPARHSPALASGPWAASARYRTPGTGTSEIGVNNQTEPCSNGDLAAENARAPSPLATCANPRSRSVDNRMVWRWAAPIPFATAKTKGAVDVRLIADKTTPLGSSANSPGLSSSSWRPPRPPAIPRHLAVCDPSPDADPGLLDLRDESLLRALVELIGTRERTPATDREG